MFIVRKLYCISILLLCNYVCIQAQNVKIPQNELFKHLLRDSNSISRITLSVDPIIPQPAAYNLHYQQLIKSKEGIYVLIDGTGRVYKALSWDNNWIQFERIDITTYYGFNKGAQKLIIGDTIFSFGGYGFWHFNGSLSYLTQRKEWEVLPLNKEIPYFEIYDRFSSISQFDFTNSVFYFSGIPVGQQTITNDFINDSFYVFDIHKRWIQALGKSNLKKADFIRYSDNRKVETPWGILFDSPLDDNKDYIINIKDNLMYVSDNRIIQQLIPSGNYQKNNLLFYKNGYLYVSSSPFDKVDSLKFNFGKFKLLKSKLYTKANGIVIHDNTITNNQLAIYIMCVVILLLISLLVYFFKNRQFSISQKKEITIIQREEILSELEKQLLIQLISKIEKNKSCTTEELNSLLGVGFKTNEIKKKARTDFITKVNYKLKQHFLMSEDVIIRNRSDEDKRSYLYSFSPGIIPKIKALVK